MRKLLIIDCDGVLYPAANLSHQDFVNALLQTDKKFLQNISAQDFAEIQNGCEMWNTLKRACIQCRFDFDSICRQIINHIEYKKIRKSTVLLSLLQATKKKFDIVILSDNHKYHLENVLQKRFGKSMQDFALDGIKCYDVTTMEKNGLFRPKKQSGALIDFCKMLNVATSNCIFIDNSKNNILAGKQAGMKTVYISRKRSLQQYLRLLNIDNLTAKQ